MQQKKINHEIVDCDAQDPQTAQRHHLGISMDETGVYIELEGDIQAQLASARALKLEMRSDGHLGIHIFAVGQTDPISIWLDDRGTVTRTE